MKNLLLVGAVIFSIAAGAQTINMANGSSSACSGTFYDSGGSGGNYTDGQNLTYTICPSTAGQSIQVAFSTLNIESGWDYLYIYNGNTTGAPLIGTYTGTTSPGTIVSSAANGCLTFRFTSDGSVNYSGWVATISCVAPPPPTIVMGTGSTSTCAATFLDPGGTGNYPNSANYTYTICPSTAGAKVQAIFTAFQTEASWDYLYIYDGNSTGATLIGTYSGATSPGTVIASAANATGCLTFRFTSDGSLNYAGWSATISCVVTCQTITANWVSSNEAPDVDGVIRICQGQSINLVGSGTFGTSGTGATYAWNMGNGVTVSGANINYTYPAIGSYLANLVITDPNGCTNSNSINRNIQVSTTPTISTSATPSTLCTNQTSALAANVTMTPYTVNCTPPVSGTTFLPDGSGVSYSTSITTNCYSPSATITTATDVTNVCLNIEHSFLGDLDIRLVCPNGQSISLKDYPGGSGTYLGAALDDGGTGPGVGATYCFTPSASVLLVNGGTVTAGNPAGPSIAPGNYMPANSFAGLIGCPMNGNWTIQVTDHLAIDNGYIFNWDINFSAALLSAASYTPTIVSQGWSASPILSSTGATTANVTPTNQGTPCFVYSITDNFGCTYNSSPQCITVNCGTSLPIGLVSFEATALDNTAVRLTWETSTEQNNDYFVVERSVSGADGWEEIATVDGAGNSQVPNYYYTMDNMPLNGISYYRLKQVDFDGQERIHEMESVYIDVAGVSDLVIFPNPATDLVTVRGDLVSLSTFRLLNAMGQDVRMNVVSYKQGDGTLLLDISTLRAGVYMIKNGSKIYSLIKQ
jgi:subtilisin-like proprotein convertase family protein